MARFAAITGLDARLFWFVPLSTLLTVVAVVVPGWLMNGPSLAGLRDLPGAVGLFLIPAVYLMPFTLPGALAAWVAARILCWRAGFEAHRAAILSGFVAGLGSMAVPALMATHARPGGWLALGLPAALGGMLAAAAVYWDGWERLSPGRGKA